MGKYFKTCQHLASTQWIRIQTIKIQNFWLHSSRNRSKLKSIIACKFYFVLGFLLICAIFKIVLLFLDLILKSLGNRLKLQYSFWRKSNIQFVIEFCTNILTTRKNWFDFMLKNNSNTFLKHVYFKRCQE
jgi:hypothetical protein